jgi:BTB/POZ domain
MVRVLLVFSLKHDKFADAHLRAVDTGEYSDFEIYCRGHVFKVHRVVLYWSVAYFKRMLAVNLKVGVSLRIIVALSLL